VEVPTTAGGNDAVPKVAQSSKPKVSGRLEGGSVVVVIDESTVRRPTNDQDPSIRGNAEDDTQRRETRTNNDVVEKHVLPVGCREMAISI
jgi:hypothetical protein